MTVNLPHRRNIALSYGPLDKQTIQELVVTFPERIGYVFVNNPLLLRNPDIQEEIKAIRQVLGLELVINTQLAGFEALEAITESYIRTHYPEIITAAMGISEGGMKLIIDAANENSWFEQENGEEERIQKITRVLLTGVLPEMTVDDLNSSAGGQNVHPGDYTRARAELAKKVGAFGVFGSAHEGIDMQWSREGLEYFATGISPDGKSYGQKKPQNVMTLTAALAIGATVVVVGSSLNEQRFGAATIKKKVALFDAMLKGGIEETEEKQ